MTFQEIYDTRPDKQEVGSSGYSNLKHLYDYCIKLKPDIIIESGTWKGNSSYLFHKACPNAVIICHDINFSNLMWKNNRINYREKDIEEYLYQPPTIKQVLLFFDDHINQEQRLKWLIKNKFKHVIFDDNTPTSNLHEYKAPPVPTLEILREQGKLPPLKQYKVLPFLGKSKRNTFLTYIEI